VYAPAVGRIVRGDVHLVGREARGERAGGRGHQRHHQVVEEGRERGVARDAVGHPVSRAVNLDRPVTVVRAEVQAGARASPRPRLRRGGDGAQD
jgi:hypothetical protein